MSEKDYSHRARIDKLGVKPESRVSIVGVSDPTFLPEVQERTAHVSVKRAGKDSDLVFFGAEATGDLEELALLKTRIRRNGAIWVIYPKGKKHITEAGVLLATKQAGLVDIKVASFNQTHTALKLVIPVAER